jgi:hypothetical protein
MSSRELKIVEQRMRDCSRQSNQCKLDGDDTRMYQLNVAWHWLDSVKRDIEALPQQERR